jgi:hypothetical protein
MAFDLSPYNLDPAPMPTAAQPMDADAMQQRERMYQSIGLGDSWMGQGAKWATRNRQAGDAMKAAVKDSALQGIAKGFNAATM